MRADRPLIYAGGGVILSNAAPELTALAHKTGIPVTTTLHGLGGIPGTDKQFLGMLGMHGTYTANMATNECDCLIAIGARFDDRVTGRLEAFAATAQKIHIDVDPSSINKNIQVDYPIVGDVKSILPELTQRFDAKLELDDWWQRLNKWRQACPLDLPVEDGFLQPQHILRNISDRVHGDDYFMSDVGQKQMWAA